MQFRLTLLSGCLLACTVIGNAAEPYDFRDSPSYKSLSSQDRKALEQVDRDFVLLWGALDMYAQDHDGQVPSNLESLVPHYLLELPSDPFATEESATQKPKGGYLSSKEGRGYHYWPGQGNAFSLASVGLAEFPYVADHGQGLYRVRGIWFGGSQFIPDSTVRLSVK